MIFKAAGFLFFGLILRLGLGGLLGAKSGGGNFSGSLFEDEVRGLSAINFGFKGGNSKVEERESGGATGVDSKLSSSPKEGGANSALVSSPEKESATLEEDISSLKEGDGSLSWLGWAEVDGLGSSGKVGLLTGLGAVGLVDLVKPLLNLESNPPVATFLT